MKFNSFKYALTLLFTALFLSGCETLSSSDDASADSSVDQSQTDSATDAANAAASEEERLREEQRLAEEARLANERRLQEEAARQQAALREVRTFYFDFDQSSIQPASRASLAAHAAFLASNPSVSVVLEGHADERGTKEYNIALGESRAKSIAQFLKVNGASASQLEVVSYGEEKPAAQGQSENAWSKNRRVYIEYK